MCYATMPIEELRAVVDRLYKGMCELQERPGTPNELLDDAQDRYTDAAHTLYMREGE